MRLDARADFVVDVLDRRSNQRMCRRSSRVRWPVGGACSKRARSIPIISSNCRRRATSAARAWVAASATGRAAICKRSPKVANTSASIASVFAVRPLAWAKARA
jgi:hypothetical protein